MLFIPYYPHLSPQDDDSENDDDEEDAEGGDSASPSKPSRDDSEEASKVKKGRVQCNPNPTLPYPADCGAVRVAVCVPCGLGDVGVDLSCGC